MLPEPDFVGRGQLCDLATFLGDLFVAFLRQVRLFLCLEESLQMGLDGPPRGQGVHRGVRLRTLVESKNSSFPHTSPASMHISTIRSKKPLKTSKP